MSTDNDKNNLLDPTNPNSPFNKFNYNGPYSIFNPLSPHYIKSSGEDSDPVITRFVIFTFIAVAVFLRFCWF